MKRLLIGCIAACLCLAAFTVAAIAIDPPPIFLEATAFVGPIAIVGGLTLVTGIVAAMFIDNPQERELRRKVERQRRRAYEEEEFARRMEHEAPHVVDFIPSRRTRFDPGRIAMPANTA